MQKQQEKKQHQKLFFTNYALDTPESSYLERNFPERKVVSNTNPTKAGHGLAATVRDLSEFIWLQSHSQYKILDIGGSLTRNGGAEGFPTFNLVLSQKDLVRGLREENLNKEFQTDLKQFIQLEEALIEKEIQVNTPRNIDWAEEEADTLMDVTTIEEDELTEAQMIQLEKTLAFYQMKLSNYKTIYRLRHYPELRNKFDWLLFNHSIYDITPEQVFEYMTHFGAKKATAFINVWRPGKKLYANTIECTTVHDVQTDETFYAQKDSAYTSFYAHKQDPRTYAVPGKFTKGNKCLSWEVRVVRDDDLIEVELSLTRAFGQPGLIQESEAVALKEEYYQVTYQDPRTRVTEKYMTKYSAPAYFQNRVDTLMIRKFVGLYPNKKQIFEAAQKIVADENRKILLTENNKTLSVNMTKEQMLDVTIHTAAEFATYIRIVRSAADDESKFTLFFWWIMSFVFTHRFLLKMSDLVHWYFYKKLDYINRTEYYNIELHSKYSIIFNHEHNDSSAIGQSVDLEEGLNNWRDTYLGWATLDGFSYGKLMSNCPTREELIETLKSTYLKTTGCVMRYNPITVDNYRKVKAATVKFADMTITLPGVSKDYLVYASARLNKVFKKMVREARPRNTTIDLEAFEAEIPEFEPLLVQKPPVQFENVTHFSTKNVKYNDDDCIQFNHGTSSTKTVNQDTQDWLKNLSARNDLINNESDAIFGTAQQLHQNLHRPLFVWSTPHEYYQRWINTKPFEEHEKLYRELDEFQNSLTDASIFLKLENLFKKFNDPQFVKAHTVTHFDKVANSILTMFAEDFKFQLDQTLRKHNIVYTDGIPTFELEHLIPKDDEFYFESDLTAQDAKQGSYTVAEFVKFYDLVGAPAELTTALFSTYTHVARNNKHKTKISNGTLKPTGGPDTGVNNLLNNLFLCQGLLFSVHHKYSQLLGDDLKSILNKAFDLDAFITHASLMGTEIKPEIRDYPEFCSNVTYHRGNIAKLVPKTEKILNTLFGTELAYKNGLTTKEKMASTLLNFATMYGHFERCRHVINYLHTRGYVNQEYNQAAVPLFKFDDELSAAMDALSKHSVYSDEIDYQIGLIGQLATEIRRVTYEYL